MFIVCLYQQPVLLAAFVAPLHVHEMPATPQLAALQLELEMALGQTFMGIAHRRPAAPVPDDNAAGTILALGNAPLELAVVERMVLHVHRQTLVVRRQA